MARTMRTYTACASVGANSYSCDQMALRSDARTSQISARTRLPEVSTRPSMRVAACGRSTRCMPGALETAFASWRVNVVPKGGSLGAVVRSEKGTTAIAETSGPGERRTRRAPMANIMTAASTNEAMSAMAIQPGFPGACGGVLRGTESIAMIHGNCSARWRFSGGCYNKSK